jgi:AhpC/TSA family
VRVGPKEQLGHRGDETNSTARSDCGVRTMAKLLSRMLAAIVMAGITCIIALLIAPADSADVKARPGAPAPAFSARDIEGRSVSLADYHGKTVILEWINNGCPFVGKHYNSGNMQALQRRFTAAGDIWLTVASSAPGKEGYVTADEARADIARWRAAPSDYLLDPDGILGHLYDARATPHMVVINSAGILAYMGAIDDKPSVDTADVKTAKNFVVAALEELAAGKPVTISATRAYGCSVKYKTS